MDSVAQAKVTEAQVTSSFNSHWFNDDTYNTVWFIGEQQPSEERIREVCEWADDNDYDEGSNSSRVEAIRFFDDMSNARNGHVVIDMANKAIYVWQDGRPIVKEWAIAEFGAFIQ